MIILQSKGYPKDSTFISSLASAKLYGGGDRLIKTKLILESIEEHFAHKEAVPFDNLTIEHIMPQTLSEWWQNYLGDDWEITHELSLHTIGNLTLTAYNTELSNDSYPSKKQLYKNSHLGLNKYFETIEIWNRDEIEKRSQHLAKLCSDIWPYFGQDKSDVDNLKTVTGTTPIGMWVIGQYLKVESWRDVLQKTLTTISDLEPDKLEVLMQQYPRLIGKDKSKFRAIRELGNGIYFEVNLSSQAIQRLCQQAIETIELTSEDWKVETT